MSRPLGPLPPEVIRQIVAMKDSGKTYVQIARKLDLNVSRVFTAYLRELERKAA